MNNGDICRHALAGKFDLGVQPHLPPSKHLVDLQWELELASCAVLAPSGSGCESLEKALMNFCA